MCLPKDTNIKANLRYSPTTQFFIRANGFSNLKVGYTTTEIDQILLPYMQGPKKTKMLTGN
jgi:hypothetical protein